MKRWINLPSKSPIIGSFMALSSLKFVPNSGIVSLKSDCHPSSGGSAILASSPSYFFLPITARLDRVIFERFCVIFFSDSIPHILAIFGSRFVKCRGIVLKGCHGNDVTANGASWSENMAKIGNGTFVWTGEVLSLMKWSICGGNRYILVFFFYLIHQKASVWGQIVDYFVRVFKVLGICQSWHLTTWGRRQKLLSKSLV